MQFLNPLALAGLAAMLIPLAVHLLHRGRPRVVPFSNVAFLRELHQSRVRSLRLRQWLVLLLRMLAIACLALAFARPALREHGNLLSGSRPASAVVLLDHSLSTSHAPPGGRVFDRLRRSADAALGLYESGRDRVWLMPFAAAAEAADSVRSVDAVRARLAEGAPGQGGTDVARALQAARQRLADETGRRTEILLFTDRAASGWQTVAPTSSEAPAAAGTPDPVLFVVTPDPGTPRNLYVAGHRIASWLATPGRDLAIAARVGQSGGDTATVGVDLYLDGERVQRRQLSLPPSSTSTVEFSVAPRRSGQLTGFIQLEDDDLPADNRRHFVLPVPARTRVLLASRQPQDAYYARRSLTAAATADATLDVQSVLLETLDEARLADADVLVLCNVEDPPAAVARAVRRYVEQGGGLLLIPGPQADLSRLNRHLLPGLLPATLAGVAGRPGATGAVRLDTARVDEGLFADLLVAADDRPRFHAFFEIVAERQLDVLARFEDGRPALLEGRPADGRALLWAVPLDQAWSDWMLRGSFVPLLHRMCRYLAQPASRAGTYTVGERAWRWLPGSRIDDRMQVLSPSGRRHFIVARTELGDLRWELPPLTEAGIWRIQNPEGQVVDELAVNVAAAESDLTPLTPEAIRARLSDRQVHLVDEREPLAERVVSLRHGRELWREFLLLGALLLLLELWIARAPSSEAPVPAAG